MKASKWQRRLHKKERECCSKLALIHVAQMAFLFGDAGVVALLSAAFDVLEKEEGPGASEFLCRRIADHYAAKNQENAA